MVAKQKPTGDSHRGLFLRPKKIKNVLQRVNEEMYARNLELARTNKTLSLLRKIDKIVLESQGSIKELSRQITDAIVETTDYPLVAIFSPKNKTELSVYGCSTRVALEQNAVDYINSFEIPVAKVDWLESDSTWYTGPVSGIVLDKVIFDKKHKVTLLDIARQLNMKSFCVVKLVARGHLVGLMVVGLLTEKPQSDAGGDDQDLITRLAGAVGVALDNKILFEENIHVAEQLKRSNNKLKALDETKDEFLSMASHQLRTPLTSVKGYLSMVLEGDAGEISDNQKHLLSEAFTSSERMVHLIHDFLNVSRLQTGKFVIEAKPVDLVKLVEAEVKALKQVAEARGMKLEYTHDKNIPMLSLDETKMQQVVMNYIDNALYYSRPENPVVKIDLKKTDDSVELRVIDGGIGVPEDEKKKLFGKFFRAGNARQKRPDGTGVGIYLAKKVIDATGGEIIFDSEVGKGSTFGFRLPIDKLRPDLQEKSE